MDTNFPELIIGCGGRVDHPIPDQFAWELT